MPLLLVQLGAFPAEIAATKSEACRKGGAFFLDFSRPLERVRWCGVWNRRLGVTMSLVVPVVHQGQQAGGRAVFVERGDPYFAELQRLWAERFPATRPAAAAETATAAQVECDFAAQFPADAAAPHR